MTEVTPLTSRIVAQQASSLKPCEGALYPNGCRWRKLHPYISALISIYRKRGIGKRQRLIGEARLSGQRWVRFVDDNAARLHHPAHLGDRDLDIGERIAIDRDDIGDIAGCDRAQAFVHAQHLRR